MTFSKTNMYVLIAWIAEYQGKNKNNAVSMPTIENDIKKQRNNNNIFCQ